VSNPEGKTLKENVKEKEKEKEKENILCSAVRRPCQTREESP